MKARCKKRAILSVSAGVMSSHPNNGSCTILYNPVQRASGNGMLASFASCADSVVGCLDRRDRMDTKYQKD